MKIILKENVNNLGYKDDVVEVKNGYARNYLIPQGKAILATSSALKVLAENQRQRAHKIAKIKADAEAVAASLEGVSLTIPAKTSSTGTIFGSVNAIQIAEELEKLGHNIDRKTIIIKNAVKEVGKYTATINLHKEVQVEIPFEVEGNGRDIQWMYGFLKRLKNKGVGIMPEDEAQYLAYKLVLEKDGLTEEERNAIFDDKGRICNNAVSYHYLLWRADAGFLTDKQKDLVTEEIKEG